MIDENLYYHLFTMYEKKVISGIALYIHLYFFYGFANSIL